MDEKRAEPRFRPWGHRPAFAILGIAVVEIDGQIDLTGMQVVFKGDGAAARTVLSVIAGSLITVAGLTFSITMVVLQLASSQFSPRVLRTFFGDRVTQITIGTFIGTFVYSILVLRAVGSFGDEDFVPRLSVTFASLLGIAAVALLIVYLNHVSRMIQVSHVTAGIAHDTLARTDVLYPDQYGQPIADGQANELLESWRAVPSGHVAPSRPGYVQRVGIEDLVGVLAGRVDRLAILVRPGDFVSVEMPIAEVWPAESARDCESSIRDAVAIAAERDLDQDVDFGVRQLADIALKAMSPGVNDPMTAITCISYLRSILVRITERAQPSMVRRFPEHDLTAIIPQREFEEYLDAMLQINRYVAGDAWVAGEMLGALRACALVAERCGAPERLTAIHDVAATIAEQTRAQAANHRDRETIDRLITEIGVMGAERTPDGSAS